MVEFLEMKYGDKRALIFALSALAGIIFFLAHQIHFQGELRWEDWVGAIVTVTICILIWIFVDRYVNKEPPK